eukprot:COSAG01_NODE_1666_length_9571_cov_4.915963_3_plen_104_part_00
MPAADSLAAAAALAAAGSGTIGGGGGGVGAGQRGGAAEFGELAYVDADGAGWTSDSEHYLFDAHHLTASGYTLLRDLLRPAVHRLWQMRTGRQPGESLNPVAG